MVTKTQNLRTPLPSKRRRLAVTLDPESWAALDRLQAAGGMAASQFVASIVVEARPVIEVMAASLERARKSPAEAIEVMRQAVDLALFQGAQASLDLDKASKRRKLRKARKATGA